MANRSDFYTAKLPRYLKRMLSLSKHVDAHEYGASKRAFIDAHKAHVAFKNKKMKADTPEVDESTEAV